MYDILICTSHVILSHMTLWTRKCDYWSYVWVVMSAFVCFRQSLSSRVQKSKDNVEAIQALMSKFSNRAFITRKSCESTLLVFFDIEESVSRLRALISSIGEQIHKLLQVFSYS